MNNFAKYFSKYQNASQFKGIFFLLGLGWLAK